MRKSVVLLSAGLDSSVNLYEAKASGEVVLALTFDYGQRAAGKEIASAKKLSSLLKIPHQVIPLSFFSQWGQSSLTDHAQDLPQGSEISIDDLEISQKTAKSVWVPNRNGIFLNIAAGFAESLKADTIVPGFNLEEGLTFPDNTQAFLDQTTKSLSYSTSNSVKAVCFTTSLKKTEIVRRGEELKVPWSLIWPCYQNLDKWCGVCESCQRSLRAFKDAGVDVREQSLKGTK